MIYRISMKITALIPDQLVADIRRLTSAKNTTESLIIALKQWRNIEQIKRLNQKTEKDPLTFTLSADDLRSLNRK